MHEISDVAGVVAISYSLSKNFNYPILLCDPKGPFKDQTEHQTVCKVEPVRKAVLIKNP